jgi:hypothetical protein
MILRAKISRFLPKNFNYKNFLVRVFITFLIGLSIRLCISQYLDINVFKEATNLVSLSYYGFMSFLSVASFMYFPNTISAEEISATQIMPTKPLSGVNLANDSTSSQASSSESSRNSSPGRSRAPSRNESNASDPEPVRFLPQPDPYQITSNSDSESDTDYSTGRTWCRTATLRSAEPFKDIYKVTERHDLSGKLVGRKVEIIPKEDSILLIKADKDVLVKIESRLNKRTGHMKVTFTNRDGSTFTTNFDQMVDTFYVPWREQPMGNFFMDSANRNSAYVWESQSPREASDSTIRNQHSANNSNRNVNGNDDSNDNNSNTR